jgi:hypothetical protein
MNKSMLKPAAKRTQTPVVFGTLSQVSARVADQVMRGPGQPVQLARIARSQEGSRMNVTTRESKDWLVFESDLEGTRRELEHNRMRFRVATRHFLYK